MDIFFQDPTDIPLPPEEVRIRGLTAEPWPDGRRVRVSLELTPFQNRPNGEIDIRNDKEEEVSSVSFIETIDPKMQFTMHLRTLETEGEFTVSATVFYPITENAEESEEENSNQESLLLPDEIMVVDRSSVKFTIPSDTASSIS
jgi:hypothetical protein